MTYSPKHRRAHRRLTAVAAGAALAALAATGACVVYGPASDARATTVTTTLRLADTADTIRLARAPRMRLGRLGHITVGTRNHDPRTSYLRFTVPAGGTVVRARLTLTRTGHGRRPVTIRIAAVHGHRLWHGQNVVAGVAHRSRHRVAKARLGTGRRRVSADLTRLFQHRRTATLAVRSQARTTRLVRFASNEARWGAPVLRVDVRRTIRPRPTSSTTSAPVAGSSASSSPVSSGPTNGDPTSSGPTNGDPTSSGATNGDPTSGDTPATCTVSALLVPSCGRWVGVAPGAHTSTPITTSLPAFEQTAGRSVDVLHRYHDNGQLFPTSTEKSLALQSGHNRLLLENWKPATDMTWAAVAAGRADARIDAEAAYLKANFPYRFFLTVWHEPENDVVATAGSGMTAADYAAMYRHTVLRLRADGVTNAVTVMNWMGFDNWTSEPWFTQLYPGNDVVDWLAIDPYGTANPNLWTAHNLATLINRPYGSFPGYYTWLTRTFPGKPIMLAEWGVRTDPAYPTGQADMFDEIAAHLDNYPALKALVYFDMPPDNLAGQKPTAITDPTSVNAFRVLESGPAVLSTHWSYSN